MWKGHSLNVIRTVYDACVTSCIYGETWALWIENVRKFERTEMRMLSLMCAVRLQDRITNADLQNKFGIDCTGCVVRRSRFRHVEHKTEENWVKKILKSEVEEK